MPFIAHMVKKFDVCFVRHTAKKKATDGVGAVTALVDSTGGGFMFCCRVPCMRHTVKCYPEWTEMVTFCHGSALAHAELTKQLLFLLFFHM